MNDNSYSEKIYFSTMPERNQMNFSNFLILETSLCVFALVIGKSQLTIATWLKFDARAAADVANIAVFALW